MQSKQLDYKGYLNLVRRRKELFVILALVIMTVAVALSYLLPRKYEASSTVFIEKNIVGEIVKGISATPAVEDTVSVLTYALTSRWLVSRAADILKVCEGMTEGERDAMIRTIQEKTAVKVKDKNLFTISYTDSDPRRARDFVNTLVRIYIAESSSTNLGQSYGASIFMSEQMQAFKERLETAERRVNLYKQQMGNLVTLDEGRLFQEIASAQQKLYDLQLRRLQMEGERQVSRRGDNVLQAKLTTLQKKLEDLRAQYTDTYPEVRMTRTEIESVKHQLRQGKGRYRAAADEHETAKLEADIAAIRSSEESLQRYITSNSELLKQIPAAKAGLEKLETERQNEKNIYDQLFARQGQSEFSKQMEVHDKALTFRVVDHAILPVKPVSPNRLKIMLLGIVVAVGGSFALLLLLDGLDSSVHDLDFVKGLTPVLAVIPRLDDPALVEEKRKRSQWILRGGALYLLFMLCFPVLELLGASYMDRVLDAFHARPARAEKAPVRGTIERLP